MTSLLNFELNLGSPVCFLKEDIKSLSLTSHLVLKNKDMDTVGLPFSPLSRASILTVAEGRAGIKSVSPRCRVISVEDLDFLELFVLNT